MATVAKLHTDLPEPLANIEAEAELLGALMFDNELFAPIAKVVQAEDFHEALHQRIFAAIADKIELGDTANPATLAPLFKTDPGIESMGGLRYLADIFGLDTGILAAPELARDIHELAVRRRLREIMRGALDASLDVKQNLQEIVALASTALAEVPIAGTIGRKFEVLDIAELEAMPPVNWLVHNTLTDDGLSIIYGEPGSYKSFLALDLSLRVAAGMDWHGLRSHRKAVLYIAGEGARGLGKRIKGWKMAHGIERFDAPFLTLPNAVQLLDPVERVKLLRTIADLREQLGYEIGLVVVDTVSRSIAGVDENSQDTMTQFVKACDEIKKAAGGALLGVHHSGKDKDRGMRGSSVLLGAVDTSIRVTKSESIVTLKFEKQKDAEQSMPLYFEMERVAWLPKGAGPENEESTLVPRRTESTQGAGNSISMPMVRQAFEMLEAAWNAGKPLSSKPQTRADGRFAPLIFTRKIGGEAEVWKGLIEAWLAGGNVVYETVDRKSKMAGLMVVEPVI